MADEPEKSLSVYRLLPSMSEYQTLHLNNFDARQLMRWQRTGTDEDRPARLRAEWLGERRWHKSEYPTGYPGAPVLSRRLVETFGDELSAAGSLVPVEIAGAKNDEYFLYVVEQVVDCLDLRRSSKPKRMDGEVKKPVFRVEALPTQLPAFRLPQFPGAVHWNGWAADRLVDLTGDEIEQRLLWSQDPTAKPHNDPWGI
ncbi:hypothetical protein CA983_12900 [Streptomyces swartbergensis]|uniref:Uncharacterized protein n=1 Tax=Streptomyces swartbergensis TaxID=487165 RepID=A0A243S5I9_9ACTN|nr:hypothetical protein CA983_12900 [Streptomyces swartbergensis]